MYGPRHSITPDVSIRRYSSCMYMGCYVMLWSVCVCAWEREHVCMYVRMCQLFTRQPIYSDQLSHSKIQKLSN